MFVCAIYVYHIREVHLLLLVLARQDSRWCQVCQEGLEVQLGRRDQLGRDHRCNLVYHLSRDSQVGLVVLESWMGSYSRVDQIHLKAS